jgi:urea-proton symporter
MNSPIMGYSVIILFAVMMTAITLFINKKDGNQNVDDLLTAGRRVPFGLVAASVCVAWIWTGTIMASAEAGVWFGINGGFNYAWGAVVPFMIFIRLRYVYEKLCQRPPRLLNSFVSGSVQS